MSLILEALRKSEAERLRAQGPGLHAPIPARPPRRVAPAWGPWVAVVLGAALVFAPWWVNRPAAPAVASAPPVPETPERTATTPPAAVPVTPAVEAPAPRVEPEPAPIPPPTNVAMPGPTTRKPPEIRDTLAPPPGFNPAGERMEPAPPAAEPEVDVAPEAPAATTEAIPGLASLPTAERAALPPLKVSMFVWHADPARRFAIVDGHRVTEGALLGSGYVAQIRRDGVVIALGERRLLLPRP